MKKVGIISVLALAMLLTACGDNTTNESRSPSTSAVSSSKETTSSIAESVPASQLSSAETSSAEPPVIQEQPEKIQLAQDEHGHFMSSDHFYYTTQAVKSGFDLTNSINDIDTLEYALSILPRLGGKADDSKNDMPEDFIGGALSFTLIYKPESAEQQIREYLLPSFKIDSIDYKNSDLWDAENGYIKVNSYSSADEELGVVESAYKLGDYYYAAMVLRTHLDYIAPFTSYSDYLAALTLNEENLNIPLVQVKFEKVTTKDEYGEHDYYIPIGFDPADQRPEWMKKAAQLYKDNDFENVAMIGQIPDKDDFYNMPSVRTAGVISTPFGKRIYLYEKNYREGLSQFYYGHTLTTFGTRGQNDKIVYSMSSSSRSGTGGAIDQMSEITEKTLTCSDLYSDKRYVHDLEEGEVITYENGKIVNTRDVHEESWTLNDKDISEKEYKSADIVSYFLENFKGDGTYNPYTFDSLYSCEVNGCITLTEYYEMCCFIIE